MSSHKEVLEFLPDELCGPSKSVTWDKEYGESTQRVLGMRWDPRKDCFTYKVNQISKKIADPNHNPTKREVLRLVMALFDPLGLLGHYSVRAKILL